MDFDFNQEQYMFQDTVKALLADIRSLEHLRAGADDALLWSDLAENGIFALALPEDHDGMALGFTDLALVLEEFGRALVPADVAAHIIGGAFIARHGTRDQQARLLPGVAAGETRISVAFAETTGTTPDLLQLAAVSQGNAWVLNGIKILAPGAADADTILLVFSLPGGKPAVAALARSTPGLTLGTEVTLDLAGRWHRVQLEDVAVTQDDLLGDAAAVTALLDMSAAVSALQMTGIASRNFDEAVDYVGQRKQFDRFIGSFQAIKHRCADMAVAVDSCRSAAYYAAWALDEAAPDERARAVSMAKSWCGDRARFVVNQAIQLHGGIGFTWELGLHLYLRRLKLEEALYGSADWHRERVIAETLRGLGLTA